MSDGATTTGSIDAKLGIDKTAWNVAVRETKTESAELGALNPEIKVDANVAEALAKFEALQMAERKLRIAELDLDKVQKDRGATQQQLLRAQNALSSATNLTQRLTTEREKDAQATARQESVVPASATPWTRTPNPAVADVSGCRHSFSFPPRSWARSRLSVLLRSAWPALSVGWLLPVCWQSSASKRKWTQALPRVTLMRRAWHR